MWIFIDMFWVRLLLAYVLTFLGTSLGFGLHVFLTYRLPSFMIANRLLISLRRGLFMGVLVGLGIFLARTLATRLGGLGAWLRFVLSVLIGGSLIALGMYGYHVIFLNRSPGWALIVSGSVLIAAGFSLGAVLTWRRWVQILASLVISGLTIYLMWQLYKTAGLDPLMFFEPSWTSVQVWLTIIAMILPIAVLGNAVNLVRNDVG